MKRDVIDTVAKAIYNVRPYYTSGRIYQEPLDPNLSEYRINFTHHWAWDEFDKPAMARLTSGEVVKRKTLRTDDANRKKRAWGRYKELCRLYASAILQEIVDLEKSQKNNLPKLRFKFEAISSEISEYNKEILS